MPLIYRDTGTSGTQLDVLSGELRIAHIGKLIMSAMTGHAVRWQWDFAVMFGPKGFQIHGNAETFEEAKAGVERNWQLWLTAAGLRD